MTKQEIIEYALTLPAAKADCPFDEDFETTILRHGDTGRWFGALLSVPEKHYGVAEEALDVKAPPELVPLLIDKYPGCVFPAYHMNKKHWLTVRFSADADLIRDLIRLSYDLTDRKRRKHND